MGFKNKESLNRLTRGDTVYTDIELGPLSSERLAELNNTRLGCIVARLLLRVIDNGSGHGGNQDDRARLASSNCSTTNSLGHHERAGQVDIDQAAPHLEIISLSGDV
jgi:hypothetical protein